MSTTDQIIDTSRQFLIDSGVEEAEATEFLEELCDAVPAFYGKFCIGVLRWIVDGEINVENNLNILTSSFWPVCPPLNNRMLPLFRSDELDRNVWTVFRLN